MEKFCTGMGWGLAVGMVVGAIVVAKNRKLAIKIKDGLGTVEEKLEEAKETLAEKLQESECCCGQEDSKNKTKNSFSK